MKCPRTAVINVVKLPTNWDDILLKHEMFTAVTLPNTSLPLTKFHTLILARDTKNQHRTKRHGKTPNNPCIILSFRFASVFNVHSKFFEIRRNFNTNITINTINIMQQRPCQADRHNYEAPGLLRKPNVYRCVHRCTGIFISNASTSYLISTLP
jgi:hypothetical protein